jgi:spore coat protein CotH
MDVPAELGPESPPADRAALVIFDDTKVHDARLEMAPEDWTSIVEDSRGDEFRPAKFYLDGVVIADVGVRPSGESSRVPGNPKMSVRVQFDAYVSKELGGFEEIKLSGSWDDPFMVRDRLGYWFFGQFMPAPREVATHLYVNGEPHGAYEIEEIWSHHSLKPYYPDPQGGLYRLRGTLGSDPYRFAGTDASAYVPLPWDRKGKADNDASIGPALAMMGQEPTQMTAAFDLDSVLNYFAGNAILANTDGFTGELEVDDHFEYFDPGSQRFFMLPWDPDNTFGSINDPPDRDIFQNFGKSILTRLLRDDPGLREQYLQRLEGIMARVPADSVNQQAARIADQIRPDVAGDDLKQYPTEHFDWSLGYVQTFVSARYASIARQIDGYRVSPPRGTP